MSWDFEFTLPGRPAVPASPGTYLTVGANLSRHHIIGRKYMQLLLALARDPGVAVSQGTLQRFAGWPVSPGTNTPMEAELPGRFCWAPFNLFVGPAGTRRAFDPSSGVEQQRPVSFSEERWAALKEIPAYFDDIGVNLKTLAELPDGGHATWTINPSPGVVNTDLTRMLKAVLGDHRADKMTIHGLHENDWAIVDARDIKHDAVRSYDDIQGIYDRHKNQIVRNVTFQDALPNDAYRFILLPPNAT